MTTPKIKNPQRGRQWLKLMAVAAGLLLLGTTGCATLQTQYNETVREKHPVPGVMVDVGGHSLHLDCRGSGSPVVVLEAGLTGWSQDWSHVQPALATDTTVCSYDRAGYGWSDRADTPNTITQNVEDLRSALLAEGYEPKWLLVGHSLGGLHSQVFARLYPEEIHGVVLVDSLESNLMEAMSDKHANRYNRNIMALSRLTVGLSKTGITRALGIPITIVADRHPTEAERKTAKAMGLRTDAFRMFRDEVHRVPEWLDSVELLPPYPDVPTVVMSTHARADQPPGFGSDTMRGYWASSQDRLVEETKAKRLDFPDSGHFLHIEEAPVVIREVRSLLEDTR